MSIEQQMMGTHFRSELGSLRKGLRTTLALGVALPILFVLSLLSITHYWRESQLLDQQIELTSLQIGEVALAGLRHSLVTNDPQLIHETITAIGDLETVNQVQIVSLGGRVWASSEADEVGATKDLNALGCGECHRYPSESRPRATYLQGESGVMRISTPLVNEGDCSGCHMEDLPHLGVLLLDASMVAIRHHVLEDLRLDLGLSAAGSVLITLGVYLILHRLVIRRAESFREPLAQLAAGDFSARLSYRGPPKDELEELAQTINSMAQSLERQERQQEGLSEVRKRAMVEERLRIARELHDGMAQLLGYVNTKAMAVRVMLQNHQSQDAEQHLLQLEQASRELFTDVRETILGLDMSRDDGLLLADALEEYAYHFNRFSGSPVETEISSEARALMLPREAELHLLRIVQEALTNVRKHASASRAVVKVSLEDQSLLVTVGDNGAGFDPDDPSGNGHSQFGLRTMRERAEAIGAAFQVKSKPGSGTQIAVRVDLSKEP